MAIRMVGCALLVLMATGCSTVSTRGFSCPSSGDSGWTRYSTPHVVFDTALREPVAREVVTLLELSRATLRQTTFQGLREEPLHVVWVPVDLLVAGPRGIAATGPDLRSGSIVGVDDTGAMVELGMRGSIISGKDDPPDGVTPGEAFTIWRTVARVLTVQKVPTRPLWLEEGLAAYHEAARFNGDDVVLGIAPSWALSTWRLHEGPKPSALIGARRCETRTIAESFARPAASFLLVHYLGVRRAGEFTRYITALADGQGHAEAWSAAFPDPSTVAALDREVTAYAQQQKFRAFGHPVRVSPVDVQSRSMTCEEVRTARIDMFGKTGDRERMEAEVNALLAETPGSASGQVAKARLESGRTREARIRAVLARDPGSAEGWAELAELLPSGDERWRAADRAAELGEGTVKVEQAVASARVDQGRHAEALELAQGLIPRVPWSIRAATTLTKALVLAGRCDEARAALRRTEHIVFETCSSPEPSLEAARAAVAACVTPRT